MQRAEFNIRLSRERFMRHYQGKVSGVVVTTDAGLTVGAGGELPFGEYEPFIAEAGKRGMDD